MRWRSIVLQPVPTDSVLRIRPDRPVSTAAPKASRTAKPRKQLRGDDQGRRASGCRKSRTKLWGWLIEQDQKTLLAILAVCAGHTVDAVEKRARAPRADALMPGSLPTPLKLDMADYWQPTAEGYFGRVSKELILDAVREGVGYRAAAKIAALKKDDHGRAAPRELLAGKGWLPAILREAC